MTTLSLNDVMLVVAAAWDRYGNHVPKTFKITVSGNLVEVTIAKRGNSFDCGMPGYWMANADVDALAVWVPGAIRINTTRGSLAPCKNEGQTGQVNVQYPGFVLFNFHVNLEDPC